MGPPASINVLHVDDEPALTELVATFLHRENERLTVQTASSASEGLDRLAENGIDCIVSDYDMPGQNGLEFLQTVRKTDPELPFILYTGKGSEEIASEAIATGVTDYLQKHSGSEQYELLANRITNAVEQYRSTQQAANLERIRSVIRKANRLLVRAETRQEVEHHICQLVSDADPYRFTWIGEYDPASQTVSPSTAAGLEKGYLDVIEITTDEQSTGQGPTGMAIRNRALSVVQNIPENAAFEPWREEALDRGYLSSASIPLIQNDTLYGVLNVYANRIDAFDAEEQELLQELADDTSHALHRLETDERLQAYDSLVENLPVGVYRATPGADGELINVNPTLAEMIGADSPEELEGRSVRSLYHDPTEGEALSDVIQREGFIEGKEVRQETSDGDEKWCSVTAIRTTENEEIYFDGIVQDITERKEREQELRRTQRFIEESLDALQDMFFVLNEGGELTRWNKRVSEVTGYTDEEIDAMAATAFFQEEQQERILNSILEILETGTSTVRADLYTKTGERIPYEFRGTRLQNPHGEGLAIAGVGRDISDLKEQERKLARQGALLEAQQESVLDGILVVNEDNEMISYNGRFAELWNIPKEVVEQGNEASALEYATKQLLDPEEFHEKVEYLYDNVEETSRDEIELTDGRTFDRYTTPLHGEDGTYYGRLWTFRDITEHIEREAELQRQNERLEEFTSIVSHDLRNPLNVAQGRVQLAREECDSEDLEIAGRAHERTFALIDDLLTLSREGESVTDIEHIELGRIVNRCWQHVETLESTLVSSTEQTIRADRNRLEQLLENLIRNAVEYGGDDVTVTVGDIDGGFYIEDSGPGIRLEDRDAVFDVGFSTRPDGTGFGLSIVKQVTDAHDWSIGVTEGTDGGARFEVTGVELPEKGVSPLDVQ